MNVLTSTSSHQSDASMKKKTENHLSVRTERRLYGEIAGSSGWRKRRPLNVVAERAGSSDDRSSGSGGGEGEREDGPPCGSADGLLAQSLLIARTSKEGSNQTLTGNI